LQRLAGLDPQLLDQAPTRVLVLDQRVGLPIGLVERLNQQETSAFPQWLLAGQRLQVRNCFGLAPEREADFRPSLHRTEFQLLVANLFGLGEGTRNSTERRTAPQGQRTVEFLKARLEFFPTPTQLGLLNMALELPVINVMAWHSKFVPRIV
jgi:hypothetical protein